MTVEPLQIGVWVKNGKVFRRDSRKEPIPRSYLPADPDNLERVVLLVKALSDGAGMESWTAQTEAQQDQLLATLGRLISPQVT